MLSTLSCEKAAWASNSAPVPMLSNWIAVFHPFKSPKDRVSYRYKRKDGIVITELFYIQLPFQLPD